MLAPPELLAVHPLGKSPVVTIKEDGKTVTLAESGAICEFILERYGGGKLSVSPTEGGILDRADYLYWLHYAEGTIMTPLLLVIIFAHLPRKTPFYLRPLAYLIASGAMTAFVNPTLRKNFDFIEQALGHREFFVGDKLTGADVMMVFPIEALDPSFGWEDYPHTKAWFDRISSRPAYQRAVERGGPNRVAAFRE
ncbi:hypothetical protein RQP46_009788 [Phenoliferia psychrophenolica]